MGDEKRVRSVELAVTILAAACVVASCAHVHQQFAAYEGPNAERSGLGGTKITSDGIDFWTTGTPPRRFRVLGILTDTRRNQQFAAASFDSDVAAKVRAVGGDAVVYLSEDKEYVGTYNVGQASATTYGNTTHAYGSGVGVAISNKTTQLEVIKYLE